MAGLKLRLFITGHTPHGQRALANLLRICAERVGEECPLEVVDVLKQPELAADAQIIATPTLIREGPLPLRRVIGDLSDADRVMAGLELTAAATGDNL